jgi:hypothetical protein
MTGARTAVTTGETGERTAATASRDSAVRVRTCLAEKNGLRLEERRTLVHRGPAWPVGSRGDRVADAPQLLREVVADF